LEASVDKIGIEKSKETLISLLKIQQTA